MFRILHRGTREDRGAAAVEFALVLPILLLLVLGIVQFGMTFFQWLEMEHAAREGARWGSLGYTVTEIQAKVIEAAPGIELESGDIVVTPDVPADHQGDSVVVEVTYDTPVMPIIGSLMGETGADMTLRARAVHLIE